MEHDDDVPDPDVPVVVPIGPELDLHTFAPGEVQDLVWEYLDQARARGLAEVRIVHGKGTGSLRRTVEAVLRRHPAVERFGPASHGGWGATAVRLRTPVG